MSSAVCLHCSLDPCVCLFLGETFVQGKTFENTPAGFSNKLQGEPRLRINDPEKGVPPDQRGTLGKPSQEREFFKQNRPHHVRAVFPANAEQPVPPEFENTQGRPVRNTTTANLRRAGTPPLVPIGGILGAKSVLQVIPQFRRRG